ncbi:MAG TPA: hypothetical protein VFA75_12145 [Nevskia sp.]|nr:hypothetical protein [Nevskia sp.]
MQQGQRGMRSAAQTSLGSVEDKIPGLTRIRGALRMLFAAYPRHGALDDCPSVNALNQDQQ